MYKKYEQQHWFVGYKNYDMTYLPIIWGIDISLNCLAIFLHGLGICAIIRHGRKKSNQSLILLHLSLTEIICAAYMAANDIIREVRYE